MGIVCGPPSGPRAYPGKPEEQATRSEVSSTVANVVALIRGIGSFGPPQELLDGSIVPGALSLPERFQPWRCRMFSPRLAGSLVLATAVSLTLPSGSPGAQVCGCKNSKGRISRISQPPVTCSSTQTQVCWNEDPPPGDISARVFNSADIPVPSDTPTFLTFDSERWDTDSIHDTSVNPGRLTARTAGKYFIFAHVAWEESVSSGFEVQIRLNGTFPLATEEVGGATTGRIVHSIATHYALAAKDYVELLVFQSSGGTLHIAARAEAADNLEFGMVKLP